MFQSAQLIGRLGADPEVRFLPDGMPVANLRIATDESYKNKEGEKVVKTEWHRVVLFSKLAEVAGDYMKKGRLVMIEGKLRTRKWTDDKNIDRYTTEIVGRNIRMLDKSDAAKAEKPATADPDAEAHHDTDDNVPF